jgi:hypothetical protein
MLRDLELTLQLLDERACSKSGAFYEKAVRVERVAKVEKQKFVERKPEEEQVAKRSSEETMMKNLLLRVKEEDDMKKKGRRRILYPEPAASMNTFIEPERHPYSPSAGRAKLFTPPDSDSLSDNRSSRPPPKPTSIRSSTKKPVTVHHTAYQAEPIRVKDDPKTQWR